MKFRGKISEKKRKERRKRKKKKRKEKKRKKERTIKDETGSSALGTVKVDGLCPPQNHLLITFTNNGAPQLTPLHVQLLPLLLALRRVAINRVGRDHKQVGRLGVFPETQACIIK